MYKLCPAAAAAGTAAARGPAAAPEGTDPRQITAQN